ncbi:MAG: hypothetical protein JXB25_12845 [Deltaproteobacteria bacterium]|nr:hypothetical protein [Deltaproteobacteria bacterium]
MRTAGRVVVLMAIAAVLFSCGSSPAPVDIRLIGNWGPVKPEQHGYEKYQVQFMDGGWVSGTFSKRVGAMSYFEFELPMAHGGFWRADPGPSPELVQVTVLPLTYMGLMGGLQDRSKGDPKRPSASDQAWQSDKACRILVKIVDPVTIQADAMPVAEMALNPDGGGKKIAFVPMTLLMQ